MTHNSTRYTCASLLLLIETSTYPTYAFSAEGNDGSSSGIFTHPPREAGAGGNGAVLVDTIEMGHCTRTMGQIEGIIDEMRDEYLGSGYHLLLRNCNHFAEDLCHRLLGRPLPPYVNRLAFVGGCATMCVPPQYLSWLGKQSAPVNGSTAGVPRTAPRPRRGASATNPRAFNGHGNRLGGSAGGT